MYRRFKGTVLSILRFYRQIRPSTAQTVSQALRRQGIAPEQILGRHLEAICQKVKRFPDAPDFTFVEKALPRSASDTGDDARPLWGVIVETRRHPALEIVVNNIAATVGAPIQLFHGVNNHEFILSSMIASLVSEGRVILTPLRTEGLGASQYNALLLSESFWQAVRGRKKILVFQTDAIACRQSDYLIGDFMSYDYIGSKWDRGRPIGMIIDGGSGGLSLRDWKKTVDCIRRFPPERWEGGEDAYYAFHLDLMGARVGRTVACAKFSTQDDFLFNSFGAHKISSLNPEDQKAFLRYCPEAMHLL